MLNLEKLLNGEFGPIEQLVIAAQHAYLEFDVKVVRIIGDEVQKSKKDFLILAKELGFSPKEEKNSIFLERTEFIFCTYLEYETLSEDSSIPCFFL